MSEDFENNDNRDGNAFDEEKQLELSLRPTRLAEYIGQTSGLNCLTISNIAFLAESGFVKPCISTKAFA